VYDLSRNQLLAALPHAAYLNLLPNLERVPLVFEQVLYEPGERMEYVYFPNYGVVSLLTIMANSTKGEVGLIGNEGMVGIPVFLGVETTSLEMLVQIPGDAMRMKVSVFKKLLNRSDFYNLLQHYTHALMFQTSQISACNSYHSVAQRCCRWLLMSHDRVNSDSFPLTHKFLAYMLGVRRASVTVVANKLQQTGLIRYHRGQIVVVDRLGLEQASCECYKLIKSESDRWG
jgi:CRP-like cAMP-binding protein